MVLTNTVWIGKDFIINQIRSLLVDENTMNLLYDFIFITGETEGIVEQTMRFLLVDTEGYTYEMGPMSLTGYNEYVRLCCYLEHNDKGIRVLHSDNVLKKHLIERIVAYTSYKNLEPEPLILALSDLIVNMEKTIYGSVFKHSKPDKPTIYKISIKTETRTKELYMINFDITPCEGLR